MHTLYKGTAIFDGRGDRLLENATLLVKNDTIEAVGGYREVHCPLKARVVDLSGKWIIPGLLDCHVHLDMHGNVYSHPHILFKSLEVRSSKAFKSQKYLQ